MQFGLQFFPDVKPEQNARAALDLADYGYVLQTGETVLEGTAADLRSDPRVVETCLGLGRSQ